MFSLFFINRPKFALVISIVLVIAGGLAMITLPIAQYPEITPPQVQVTASYPGANAEVVEQAVATPIEAQVNGVDDMLYMSSTSANDGSYTLTVTFNVGTDPDQAAINVQNRVSLAQSSLPQEVVRQGVTTRKQSTNMLLVVNLHSPNNSHDALFLSNYASIYIQDELARINGVGSASQFGALDYGMRIWLDPDRLMALNLTANDITNAISQQNIQASVGIIGQPPISSGQQFQYSLRATGRLSSQAEFENIIVRANPDGSIVRLRDVARVEPPQPVLDAVANLQQHRRETQPVAVQVGVVDPDDAGHAVDTHVEEGAGHEATVAPKLETGGGVDVGGAVVVEHAAEVGGQVALEVLAVAGVELLVFVGDVGRTHGEVELGVGPAQVAAQALAKAEGGQIKAEPHRRAQPPVAHHEATGEHRLAHAEPPLREEGVELCWRQLVGVDHPGVHRASAEHIDTHRLSCTTTTMGTGRATAPFPGASQADGPADG